uniref:Type IV pilus biogenesis protein PilP n=1 Tax=mine drainage metagenome TaxID=410659 RepID=E6QB51_9ZZZZ
MRPLLTTSIRDRTFALGLGCALITVSASAIASPLPKAAPSAGPTCLQVVSPSQGSGHSSVATVGELDALYSQIALLKGQLAVAKLKHGITEAGKPSGDEGTPFQSTNQSPYGGIPSAFPMGTSPLQGASPSQRAARIEGLPQVLSISGSGTDLTAQIAMPSGGETLVQTGAKVAGGFTVRSITAHGVNVSGKHGLESLPFAPSGNGFPEPQGSGDGTPTSFPPPSFAPPASMPAPGANPPMGGMPGSGAPGMGRESPQSGVSSIGGVAPRQGGE